jgi:hypothetical protein
MAGKWRQVLDGILGGFGVIGEIKSPVVAGAFGGIKLLDC